MGKDINRYRVLIIIALILIIFLLGHFGFFEGMNHHLYDLSFRLRGSHPPIKDILLVEINEESLKKLGQWPIQRLHYSSFLDRVREAEAVILDVILSEPAKDDPLLRMSIEKHGRVILPVYINNQMKLISPSPTLGFFHYTGHIHLEQGIDGIIREVYHTLVFQKETIPSISSVAYELASRTSFPRTLPKSLDQLKEGIIQMDRMYINYCGPSGTFEKAVFSDVLNGVYPQSFFKGKILFVGVTAIGLGDQFLTPFSHSRNYISGVELQANILNTLLANNPIRVIPTWVFWPLALFSAFIFYLLFLKVSENKAILLGLAILFWYTIIFYILFSLYNIWTKPIVFYITLVSVFLVTYFMKLGEAANSLDQAYLDIIPHLRWKEDRKGIQEGRSGIKGIFSPRGIQTKAYTLSNISRQLIFEKKLVDCALLNQFNAVFLFDPEGKNLIINDPAVNYCKVNSIDWTTLERFFKGIAPYLLDRHCLEVIESQQRYATSIMSLPLPQQKYFKIDVSKIEVKNSKYILFTFSDITQIKELEILKEYLLSLKKTE